MYQSLKASKFFKSILSILLGVGLFCNVQAQNFADAPTIYCDYSEDFSGLSIVRNSINTNQAKLIPTSDIRVTYIDYPDEAKAAFERAVNIWESYISSPVPIFIETKWTGDLPDQTLASSGATRIVNNFSNAPFSNVWYVIPLAESLAGRDLNDGTADIKISLNRTIDWYTDADGNPGSSQYDLTTIALHEICHGLGFSASMKVEGEEGIWGQSGLAYIYDLFLQDGAQQKLVDPATIGNPSSELKDYLTNSELRFNISDVAYDQETPRISSENPFRPGVSTSHLDEQLYPKGNPFSLMTPQAGRAEVIHDPGIITLYMLKEMGWVISNINQNGPLASEVIELQPRIFPNPCQGEKCQILFPSSQMGKWTNYDIISAKGRLIKSGNLDLKNLNILDLEGLNPALYHVKLSGNQEAIWLRLLKL